jgi:RNA polymerase sigma factor (TIGR02999 family)
MTPDRHLYSAQDAPCERAVDIPVGAASAERIPDSPISPPDVTRLLQAFQSGEPELVEQLARAVYGQLHRLAANALRRENAGHTLQTTLLAHEAFLRLSAQTGVRWQNRSQFYRVAAQVIRRLLVDHARRRRATKRQARPDVTEPDTADPFDPDERLAHLDAALVQLAAHDARAARVVELRFFGGLTMEAVAEALQISLSTANRDWRFAQAYLRRQLEAAQSRERAGS